MVVKALALLVVLSVAVGALVWTGWPAPAEPPAPSPRADGAICAAGLQYRGLAIQVASGYKPLETYGPLLPEIAGLGANAVLLSVAGYMEHARSQSIYIEARKLPAAEEFKALLRQARALGLKTIVMPIVLLKNPKGSEWRGVIEPPDWDDWWRQYTDFVLYFADICREGEAEGLMVGSELVSTEKSTERWVRVIEEVRPRFYGGKLGYSANWDHYREVNFWDHLDFIGMTTYNTLAEKKAPSVDEIVERWGPIRKDILAWQRRIGKPIVMTEVGWCSQEGAAQAPWNYFQNQKATTEGHEEQRLLYEAFVLAWSDTPELVGTFWWEWNACEGGLNDYGYSPKNKPAEQILRQWFAAGRETTTAPAATAQGRSTAEAGSTQSK